MEREHKYFVYLLTNAGRTVLYIGVTSELESRLVNHCQGTYPGFTATYQVNRLIYFESFGEVLAAIAREKQLKGWTRAKKEALVARVNPRWEDLSADWPELRGWR